MTWNCKEGSLKKEDDCFYTDRLMEISSPHKRSLQVPFATEERRPDVKKIGTTTMNDQKNGLGMGWNIGDGQSMRGNAQDLNGAKGRYKVVGVNTEVPWSAFLCGEESTNTMACLIGELSKIAVTAILVQPG